MLNWFGQIFNLNGRAMREVTQENISAANATAGIAYKNQGDAFLDQGDWESAALCYQHAVASNPDYADAHNNLGLALSKQHKFDQAKEHLLLAISLKPNSHNAYYALGSIAHESGMLDEAIEQIKKAVAIKPDFTEALDFLGNLSRERGDTKESISYYRKSISYNPLQTDTYSNLLMALQAGEALTQAEMHAEHRQFAERFESPLQHAWQPHANDRRTERRLKIGYVSGDLRRHSVALFILPILANHDRKKFEIYCYHNFDGGDDFTTQFAALSNRFIPCAMMSDHDLSERIRADGIDILVDLSGHTGNNRLLTFARKPAPIQVTYLGYIDTTGLSTMDYRLTNADADPPGNDRFYSEELYRFSDRLWWTFRPAPNLPEVSPLPALANGFVTFASNNQIAKISAPMLEAWAAILHAVPDSRMVLMGITSDAAQISLENRFAIHGVVKERVVFHRFAALDEYRQRLLQTDICLDTFPYNGGTTTCETLWLGLPLVTMMGQSFVSRMGFAILKDLGLPDLAATSYLEYVNIAVQLAQNLERLSALRSGMRARLAKSALSDERGFTLDLESAYRTMWEKYSTRIVD